jgi:transposase
MQPSISLSTAERNTLLDYYRSSYHPPELRLRAHILLLVADGHPWATITAVLYCSSRTIARWKGRFQQGRLDALLGRPRGPQPHFAAHWAALVVRWVTETTPRAFGFLRSRWCCEVVVLLLWRTHHLDVGRETVRRWLHQADLVWRRPRPVLRKEDPEKPAILARLRHLLHTLPDDETVVFEDEVDVNLNPKIGSMWMRRGQQAEVVTPGNNEKCYLAGSLHWRTGTLLATEGPQRNGALFVAHLGDLCSRLRRYRKIHVICDNAKFHDSALVRQFLAEHAGRIEVHFLPRYAPKCNPIERVWWHLHEEITRNHTCRSLDELVDLVFEWLVARKPFLIEDSVYREPAAA